MKQVGYDDLVNLPLIAYYETAFREATGVSLKVVPPGDPEKHPSFGPSENPFCALVSRTLADCPGTPAQEKTRPWRCRAETHPTANPSLCEPHHRCGARDNRRTACGHVAQRASIAPQTNAPELHAGGQDARRRAKR